MGREGRGREEGLDGRKSLKRGGGGVVEVKGRQEGRNGKDGRKEQDGRKGERKGGMEEGTGRREGTGRDEGRTSVIGCFSREGQGLF